MRGVVFVEERSAEIVASALAIRLAVADKVWIIPHEGKGDLEKSFARKIPAWRYPPDARFVVSRDNDSSACQRLKQNLFDKVGAEFHNRIRVRLVMQELEAWYLGDFDALASSGLISAKVALQNHKKAKYNNPDSIVRPSAVIKALTGGVGKLDMARRVGPLLDPDKNRSRSLRHFCNALLWAGG